MMSEGEKATAHRVFESGANRNSDEDQVDYEGHLSPLALERYGQYMHKNRFLQDGTIRDSDNWQKGFPLNSYMKSLLRHTFAMWKLHRGWGGETGLEARKEVLCAIMFNTIGYLHELMVKGAPSRRHTDPSIGKNDQH